MIDTWLAAGSAGITSTADDTRNFALNVMLGAGFGKVYDFATTPDQADKKPRQAMDYRQALQLVLENAMLIIALGPKAVLKLGWLGNKLKTMGKALIVYQQYMVDMLNEETIDPNDKRSQGNLLATLVRASTIDKQLSQPEVFGNMFVYTFGGHDTTAHSLAFTFILLSIHSEVQDWIRDEIRKVLGSDDSSTWDFENFGKMKRTFAVQASVPFP